MKVKSTRSETERTTNSDLSSLDKKAPEPTLESSFGGANSPYSAEEARLSCRFRTSAIYWSAEAKGLDPLEQTQSSGPDVTVVDESGQCLVSVPLDFLCDGGVSTVASLRQMAGFCFEEDGRLQQVKGKTALSGDEAISQPETFVFVRSDGSNAPCKGRDGPHFRFPYGLFMNELWSDIVKAEEYVDEAMLPVHSKILKRYSKRSLFTGTRDPTLNRPFPIVPPPVADAVKQKLREEWDRPVFTKSSCFPHELLKQSLSDRVSSWLVFGVMEHLMWERGDLALWPYPGPKGYTIHTFERSPLHGKVIPRKHFRFADEGLFQRLLEFHYSQCAVKRLRGYSAGPAPCEDEELDSVYEDGEPDILNLNELLHRHDEADPSVDPPRFSPPTVVCEKAEESSDFVSLSPEPLVSQLASWSLSRPEDLDSSPDASLEDEVCPVSFQDYKQPCHFAIAAELRSKLPSVRVLDESGQCLVAIPLDFLHQGKVSDVAFLHKMVSFCYKEEGFLKTSSDAVASSTESFSTGSTFSFVRSDGSKNPCSARDGPHFRLPYGVAMGEFHYELIHEEDNDNNLTAETIHLREQVRTRYSRCLITNEESDCNKPFPIVPPAVEQNIQDLMRPSWSNLSFTRTSSFPQRLIERSLQDSSSSWLLLGLEEQHLWEIGALALWPCPEGYIVHTFTDHPLHGTVLPSERFKWEDRSLAEDLLEFHYMQCCIKSFRGFAAGPLPCDEKDLNWIYWCGDGQVLRRHETLD